VNVYCITNIYVMYKFDVFVNDTLGRVRVQRYNTIIYVVKISLYVSKRSY